MAKRIRKDVAVHSAPSVVADVDFDSVSQSALFTISTASTDRDGDVVVPEGCLKRIKTYQANPIVLFDHGAFPLPIGLSEDPVTKTCTVNVQPDRITGRVFFHCKTLESSQVCSLVAAKVLRGASIGYKGIKGKSINPQKKNGGTLFEEWELVEWSVVPVPCNQDALLTALSANWDGKSLAEPIALRLKSLIVPSKKLVFPVSVKSDSSPYGYCPVCGASGKMRERRMDGNDTCTNGHTYPSKNAKRMKAMAEDTQPDETENETAEESQQDDIPASAKVAKAALEAHKAILDSVAEGMGTLEHEKMNKAFKSYLGKSRKAYGVLAKAANEHHPDHFEAYEEVDEDDEESSEPTEEKDEAIEGQGKDTEDDNDVSNVDKSLKTRQAKSWAKECQSHVSTLKDCSELLDDMTKSANIPSGYKRQCKGVLPGLASTASWISGKSAEDLEEKSNLGNGPEDEEAEATQADAESEQKMLKALQEMQAKAAANAKQIASIKGK